MTYWTIKGKDWIRGVANAFIYQRKKDHVVIYGAASYVHQNPVFLKSATREPEKMSQSTSVTCSGCEGQYSRLCLEIPIWGTRIQGNSYYRDLIVDMGFI